MNNQLFQAAAESVNLGWLMGGMTAVFLACFSYWIWWAYSPARREKHERDGMIPFSTEEQGEQG